jgi:hypothetical protein
MTDTPMHQIVNCETGEVEIRSFTDEEMAQLEIDRVASEEARAIAEAEAQAKADAKASALAKLTALGLTEEEAQAIIS